MKRIVSIIKTLIATYIVSVILLCIIAGRMYKFDIVNKLTYILMVVTYIISTFVGGFIIGRVEKKDKYLWGGVLGFSYFLILLIISLVVGDGITEGIGSVVSVMLYCIVGGTIGGMIS